MRHGFNESNRLMAGIFLLGGLFKMILTAARRMTRSGKHSSTIPAAFAALARNVLPVKIISIAVGIGAILGNLTVPPHPGKMPNNISGNPNLVEGLSSAMR